MHDHPHRRDILAAAGTLLLSHPLRAFSIKDLLRPPGSLQPLSGPLQPAAPEGVIRTLGKSAFRMNDSIRGMRISTINNLVVSACSNEIRFWDLTEGKVMGQFRYPKTYSPDSGIITTRNTLLMFGKMDKGGTLEVRDIDIPSGICLSRGSISGRDNKDDVSFSADGKYFLLAQSGQVSLYEVAGAKQLWKVDVTNTRIYSTTFLDKKGLIAIGFLRNVHLLDLRSGKKVAAYENAIDVPEAKDEAPDDDDVPPFRLLVSPDGEWLGLGRLEQNNKTRLAIWDLKTGQKRKEVVISGNIVDIMDPDGQRLLMMRDRRLIVLDWASGKELHSLPVQGESPKLMADQKSIIYENNDCLFRVDLNTGKPLAANPDPPDLPLNLIFLTSNRLIGSLPMHGGWMEWDVNSGQSRMWCPPSAVGWHPLHYGADGTTILVGNKTMARFDPTGKQRGKSVPVDLDDTKLYVVDRTSENIIYYDQDKIWHFNFDTGKKAELKSGTIRSWDMQYSRNQEYLAILMHPNQGFNPEERQVIDVWNVQDSRKSRTIPLQNQPNSLAISGDGNWLATASYRLNDINMAGRPLRESVQDTVIEIRDTQTNKVVFTHVSKNSDSTLKLTFSPDNRLLLAATSERMDVIDFRGGCLRRTLPIKQYFSLAFSPNGRLLAGSIAGAPVYIWDLYPAPTGKDAAMANLDQAWEQLLSVKDGEAYPAYCQLLHQPEKAAQLFRTKIKPATGPDLKKLNELVEGLDHAQYRIREACERELRGFGSSITEYLRNELNNAVTEEKRSRLQRLTTGERPVDPSDIRLFRVVEIAQINGSEPMKQLLQQWAKGFPGHPLTREAQRVIALK